MRFGAEFFRLLDEMAAGPAPPPVAGTFRRDELYADDELPPAVPFPVVKTVRTRFVYAGRLEPLPMDDGREPLAED